MNIIIDTHIFLWLIFDPSKINNKKLKNLENTENKIFITSITLWEISLKFSLGKLELNGVEPNQLIEIADSMSIDIIDIDKHSMTTYNDLPSIKGHRDPFDRIIIWHCIKNSYKLASQDKQFTAYKPFGLELI